MKDERHTLATSHATINFPYSFGVGTTASATAGHWGSGGVNRDPQCISSPGKDSEAASGFQGMVGSKLDQL